MLSIGVMAGGQGHYYQQLAREDYYLEGGEPVGKWFGKAAEHFGLAGKKVTAKALESFLDGFSPDGEPLVQNAGGKMNQERRPGFDLTFSAPKTVSALWAIASPEVQREIQAAQDAAVKAALTYLERSATFTRTGKGGTELHRAVFLVALYEHGTSRALDPQLHTHALLMNFGLMEDGRTRALMHTEFFAKKMTAGALYRVELARQLEMRLGVEIEQDPHAYKKGGLGFKVAGISEALCDFWSKRRDAIEKELGEWGVESAAAAAAAAKSTRDAKEIVPPRGKLFERWREEAKALGIDPSRLKAFRGKTDRDPDAAFDVALAKTLRELTAAPQSRIEAKTIGGRLVMKVVDAVLSREDERAYGLSHFSESLLLRRLAENCQAKGIDAGTLLAKFADAIEHSPSIVRLDKSKTGEHLLTTEEVLKLEEQMLKSVGVLNSSRGHGVALGKVEKAIQKHDRKKPDEVLGPEREAAVKYLTDREAGSVRCLEGWAGTAKTTLLSVVKDLYEKQGYKVLGTAVAGKAVKQLHNGGEIKQTFTLRLLEIITDSSFAAQWKHHARQMVRAATGKPTFKFKPLRLDDKTVVICDEASMVETRQMAMLAERVQKAGGLLILVGDRDQIQAVGRGGSFSHIADQFGSKQLTDIVRQREDIDREAVKDMHDGKAEKVLKSFAERDLLSVEKDRHEAIAKLVTEWTTIETGHKKDKSLIFVGTNKDADFINRECQRARLNAGEMRAIAKTSVGGQTFYRGDRVLFRKISRAIGVNNGETGTIVAINPIPILKTLTVKLDDGQKVVVPLRDYKDISLGYAVTTHKGQGSTVERAYVLLGGSMQDKEISYVQVSRAKGETRLYTTEADAGEQNKNLAKQMEKSNEKTLAHAKATNIEQLRQERTLRQTLER